MKKKLKVGIVGLGRMGKEYATNLKYKARNVELIAACSLRQEELEFASKELDINQVFADYDKMLELKELEAVFIITSTNMHASQIIKALHQNKHVFCEKPLALTVEECQDVLEVSKRYPHLITSLGFVRRFDKSYSYAKQKVDEGAIGTPFMVRSQTVDMDTVSEFQLQYVGKSGGIFHDYNVHDIDLARWFLKSEFQEVYALGGAFKHKGFEEMGDADNVLTTCKMVNGSIVVLHASRTAMHGHDTYTEVTGTLGSLRIGRPAGKNRVEIYDQYGARKECLETYLERFEEGFVNMIQNFVDCVITGTYPETTINNALKATEAAVAITESFRSQGPVSLTKA